MSLRVVPCTIKAAMRWIAEHHRHLPLVNGGRFTVAIADDSGMRGVGMVGNGPRVWEGTSKMIMLGYTEAWTYTLPDEPGTSLRAAGFAHMGESAGGGNHSSTKRHREPAVCPQPKQRWMRKL